MSGLSQTTDHGHTCRIDSDEDVELFLPDMLYEIFLSEMDLRLMLSKVERAKYNPSGRSVERKP